MSRAAVFFLLILAPALALVLALLGLETANANPLGWLLLVIGISYPVAVVVYYWIRKRPFWESKDGGDAIVEEIGDTSFWLILPGMLAAFFGPPLEYIYFTAIIPRENWVEIIGLALIVTGVVLQWWTRSAIQGQYSGRIRVTTKHQLVDEGPYHYIRHPAYAGYFLLALGICIGYSSLIGLIAIPILMVPGFAYRMNIEEHLLAQSFGERYRIYASKTKRIIPGVW